MDAQRGNLNPKDKGWPSRQSRLRSNYKIWGVWDSIPLADIACELEAEGVCVCVCLCFVLFSLRGLAFKTDLIPSPISSFHHISPVFTSTLPPTDVIYDDRRQPGGDEVAQGRMKEKHMKREHVIAAAKRLDLEAVPLSEAWMEQQLLHFATVLDPVGNTMMKNPDSGPMLQTFSPSGHEEGRYAPTLSERTVWQKLGHEAASFGSYLGAVNPVSAMDGHQKTINLRAHIKKNEDRIERQKRERLDEYHDRVRVPHQPQQ